MPLLFATVFLLKQFRAYGSVLAFADVTVPSVRRCRLLVEASIAL